MGILQHVTDSNIAAFNNMLIHVSQKGSEKTFNKRAGKATPVVQFVPNNGYIAYNCYLKEVSAVNSNGAVTASAYALQVSVTCYRKRNQPNE